VTRAAEENALTGTVLGGYPGAVGERAGGTELSIGACCKRAAAGQRLLGGWWATRIGLTANADNAGPSWSSSGRFHDVLGVLVGTLAAGRQWLMTPVR
jgi:hypothetical protein